MNELDFLQKWHSEKIHLKASFESLEKIKESDKKVKDKLSVYLNKCQDFQEIMTHSNESFEKFRKEMEKV